MNACSVPIPPGVAGTSVARLWVTWMRSTFRMLWLIPKAPRKYQIAQKRRDQSPSCQTTTSRRYRENGWKTRERLRDAARGTHASAGGSRTSSTTSPMPSAMPRATENRRGGGTTSSRTSADPEDVDAREHPLCQRPAEDAEGQGHVHEREDSRRRDDRGVGARGNRAVREYDADHVAAACRESPR